jgi:mono/diheme cytochrome c family protein
MARRVLTAACLAAAALIATGCGSASVDVAKDDPVRPGAVLFAEKCGGCHTLSKAGTHGSAENVKNRERTDGPNLDKRQESEADVLFAIANGGFSGAIMPENIATGAEAKAIAQFLAKYSGSKRKDAGG